jgi:hypothetical protein
VYYCDHSDLRDPARDSRVLGWISRVLALDGDSRKRSHARNTLVAHLLLYFFNEKWIKKMDIKSGGICARGWMQFWANFKMFCRSQRRLGRGKWEGENDRKRFITDSIITFLVATARNSRLDGFCACSRWAALVATARNLRWARFCACPGWAALVATARDLRRAGLCACPGWAALIATARDLRRAGLCACPGWAALVATARDLRRAGLCACPGWAALVATARDLRRAGLCPCPGWAACFRQRGI